MNAISPSPSSARPIGRVTLFLLLLLGGQLVYVFASPYFDVFPSNDDPLFAGGLTVAFGLAALGLHRSADHSRYAPLAYALFVGAAANLALVIGPFNRLITATEPFQRMAQDKVVQFLSAVPVILILAWLPRHDLGRVYLQRGRPRRWLAFGLAGFLAGLVAMVWILLSSGMSAGSLLGALPWIMTFVAANAVMEELWFRGIFLRPYEDGVGWAAAMVLTALAYGTSHMSATYFESATGMMFGLGVIGLGLILAWSIRWSNSLWGAVLFHMGMDLVIILPVVQSV